ncbi:hypothetical protein [Mesoterricola sediminis]|uniref:Uncharacterized protein n=1 Tax=Mesoterricola sediminis TaxID=2927980 RepID=A0AA48GNG1_9BACT|nr:hypothetical protein [Mesoterricola sediminis]BDU76331.1 hypothetical protein METESE_12890 [Mesoterricola sediminis]
MKTPPRRDASPSRWGLGLLAMALGALALAASARIGFLAASQEGIGTGPWELAMPSTLALVAVAVLVGRYAYLRAPSRAIQRGIPALLIACALPWAIVLLRLAARP